jgi:hypothetical protein
MRIKWHFTFIMTVFTIIAFGCFAYAMFIVLNGGEIPLEFIGPILIPVFLLLAGWYSSFYNRHRKHFRDIGDVVRELFDDNIYSHDRTKYYSNIKLNLNKDFFEHYVNDNNLALDSALSNSIREKKLMFGHFIEHRPKKTQDRYSDLEKTVEDYNALQNKHYEEIRKTIINLFDDKFSYLKNDKGRFEETFFQIIWENNMTKKINISLKIIRDELRIGDRAIINNVTDKNEKTREISNLKALLRIININDYINNRFKELISERRKLKEKNKELSKTFLKHINKMRKNMDFSGKCYDCPMV